MKDEDRVWIAVGIVALWLIACCVLIELLR